MPLNNFLNICTKEKIEIVFMFRNKIWNGNNKKKVAQNIRWQIHSGIIILTWTWWCRKKNTFQMNLSIFVLDIFLKFICCCFNKHFHFHSNILRIDINAMVILFLLPIDIFFACWFFILFNGKLCLGNFGIYFFMTILYLLKNIDRLNKTPEIGIFLKIIFNFFLVLFHTQLLWVCVCFVVARINFNLVCYIASSIKEY